uniref:Uncharacterized protein n=1 Tax=viral metagenome TaxID=1070528 RepID=A0A6C0CAY5_9ZZZZ
MIQVLLSLFILANSCKRCVSKGIVYDCGDGAIIQFGPRNHIGVCCDGVWNQCQQSNGLHCSGHCPINHKVSNNTPQILNKFVSVNDRSYSDYVTVAKLQNTSLESAKLVSSLDLNIADSVLWKGDEFGKKKDVIVRVMRNDKDHLNPICCTNTTDIYKLEIYCGRYCNRCPTYFSSSSIICDNQIHGICCNSPIGGKNDRGICICEKNPICECF